MRVALLVTDLQPGGTPLRLARLARGLTALGVDVRVGCLAPRGTVGAQLEAAGLTTFACDARGPTDLPALSRLFAHLREFRPDLLHATLLHANVAGRLFGALLGVPVLTSSATIEVERRWHAWAERLTARCDRGHIVNSAAIARHVIAVFRRPAARVFVVPPAIDPPACPPRESARAALNIPPHEFVVLWSGRLDPVKRVERVLGAAELLTDVPCRFLVAGDGPARVALEPLVRMSPAARIFHLLGWRDDLPTLLAAADAFVFPSLTEGVPNAVLEALWCGLPVVATDLPTLRALVDPDADVLQLIPDPTPTALATALRALRADPASAAARGERAVAWARQHLNPAETAAATLAVYQRVLNRPATVTDQH